MNTLPKPEPDAHKDSDAAINSPANPANQVIVAGRQLWKRTVSAPGVAPGPVTFTEPEDLR